MRRGIQLLALALACAGPIWADQFGDFGRERAREMLRNIADDVKKHYYDPKFHGLDFDAKVRETDEKLRHVNSVTESLRVIASALQALNDTHTYFTPPRLDYRVDYGWQKQMIGDRCYVIHVRPKSDAEAKGMKAGDEVLSVNGTAITRASFPMVEYILVHLSPQPELHLQLRGADGQQRQLLVAAKVEPIKFMATSIMAEARTMSMNFAKMQKKNRPRCESLGDDLGICRMPVFDFEDQQVHDVLNFARKHKALILDLRGNHSGSVQTLQSFLGAFSDHEIKIADRISRGGAKAEIAKPQHDPFTGRLAVLIDSQSESSAELFARTMQLQRRGTVMGDRSAGSVMEASSYIYKIKMDSTASYYSSITDADYVMPDGQRLEGHGVIPDETLLPTQADLLNGDDPVLAHAAESLGIKLTPEKAGKLFPFEWPEVF